MLYMKTTLLLLCAATILAACNKNADNRGGNLADIDKTEDIMHKLQTLHVERDTTINGHKYSYVIDRISNDSLGIVTDELGARFADTELTISVKRDGSPLFNRTFHKESFSDLIDEHFLSQSILDGCMFYGVEQGNVMFSLAVSYPESDMSQPLMLTIDPSGHHSVRIDNSLNDEPENDSDNDGV